ncbi:major facilitator superfamily transporter [Apiospora saccharicola]|uniref:Major facilitator superfamily transporter n=1 Tax=Apiospora saccharicola TaxID=335842 RepID=A0ABR1UZV6_9PEZI
MDEEKKSRTEVPSVHRGHIGLSGAATGEEPPTDAVTSQSPRTSLTQSADSGLIVEKTSIWTLIDCWMPQRCRYDPKNPPQFTLATNILLGFAGTFTVANLYYPQPILNLIAKEFDVSYERSSLVATLSQGGYAVGLLLVCPLGDKVPRRPFVLLLVFLTATVWLGLCLTKNFNVFIALSFICGVGTVTPQIMLPLVGDLAPPEKRAASLSVVVSGLAMGLLIARVLSGIVANYTDWRNIYWLAFGAQYTVLILLFFFLPDYPAKDAKLPYFRLLSDIVKMVLTEPLLLQACLSGFLLSAAFTSFWTTLTFLLASPPYSFSSLEIGLFAFIGIAVIALGPLWSRLITDRFVPLFSVVLGLSFEFVGVIVGTFIGSFSIAGPIVQAIMMDTGANFAHTANRSNVYNLDPKARNRVNTAYMVFCFAGQLTGTAVGNRLYAHGGWVYSGGCNIAFIGAAILICFARGPRESGWLGWHGGWNIRRESQALSANVQPLSRGSDTETAIEGVGPVQEEGGIASAGHPATKKTWTQ